MADVCFGNPPQLYKAAFDTGSSNTWIIGSRDKQQVFNSRTSEDTNQSASVYFGSGALNGKFIIDEVRIGNECLQKNNSNVIDIKRQKFGVANEVKGFRNVKFNAIIGMAYSTLAQNNVTTVFDNIMKQKALTKNLFSFYVVDDREEKLGGLQSEIALGYFDTKKFLGELEWHPVVFKYMFGLKLDDILMNNKSLGLGCKNSSSGDDGCLVTIDSGTSHLAFPSWAMDKTAGIVPS